MMFFKVLEGIVMLVIVVFIYTQMVVPGFTGRTLFPLFRKQGKLEKKVAELKQKEVEKELQSKINEMKGK